MLEERILELIEKPLDDEGYEIIKLSFNGVFGSKILSILAERKSDQKLNVDDCGKISRQVSEILDTENMIAEKYNLEVSSPGLDRPLVKKSDYKRFEGFLVSTKLKTPINEYKKFKGRIVSSTESSFKIKREEEDEIYEIPFSEVDSAKIVITDKLLKNKGSMN